MRSTVRSAICWLSLSSVAFLAPISYSAVDPHFVVPAHTSDELDPQDLERFQGHLDPAPDGMDVRYAWGLEGGRGENVRIVDIEVSWNLNHNDLIAATAGLFLYEEGIDPRPQDNVEHGTAVLGEMVAAADGIGVTGIAHQAGLGLINPIKSGNTPDVAGAVTRAAQFLEPGDVILIEVQSIGPRFDFFTGRGLVPPEFDPRVFEAIASATSRGIAVVEPAANGFDNLDHAGYGGAFDRRQRDSGAIIVGSGMPPEGVYGPGPDRTRSEESNWGSRVDVQAWGRSVTTCGYGDLRREGGHNNWFTGNFGGTSGAAAMVAGAAAVIQSIAKARGRAPLTPFQLRRLLVETGSPQTGKVGKHIGPRPDLRAAIDALEDLPQDLVPTVTSASYNEAKGRLVIDGGAFLPGDSVVEIDHSPVAKHKYPVGFWLPDGTTTRIVTKGDITALLPRGVTVLITVFTRSTGKRSEPVQFRRD